jgi:PAP2 superfamily protein
MAKRRGEWQANPGAELRAIREHIGGELLLLTTAKQQSSLASWGTAMAILCCLCISSARAQSTPSGCGLSSTTHQALSHARPLLRAIEHAPHNAIRPENLKWELPIAAATGVLIAEGDQPAADRIQGRSIQHLARLWSNVGLGTEIGAGFATWGIGCIDRKPSLRDNGLTALTAMGAAGTLDLALKLTFDREFPYKRGSHGEFWGGGRSFPSGHAATSFAFAAAIAHRYPRNRWVKWGAYGLATGVALSRYPGKRHYLSDILVGSTLGYVTGVYVAEH